MIVRPADWYYVRAGERRGPLAEDALAALVRSGEVRPFELVWTERIGAWAPVIESGLPALTYAPFGLRFAAALIDAVVLFAAQLTAGAAVGIIVAAAGGRIDPDALNVAGVFLWAFVAWLYCAMCESSRAGATLGKRAVGISVLAESGHRLTFPQASGRWIARAASVIPLGIGYLAMLWSPRRQCWHDRLARTFVVQKGRA